MKKLAVIILLLAVSAGSVFAELKTGTLGGQPYIVLVSTKDIEATLAYDFLFHEMDGVDGRFSLRLTYNNKFIVKDIKVYFEDEKCDIELSNSSKYGDRCLQAISEVSADTVWQMNTSDDFTIRIRYFNGDELESVVVDKEQIHVALNLLMDLYGPMAK